MRLIDADEINIKSTIGGKNDYADCIRDSVKTVLDNAPTIEAYTRQQIQQIQNEIYMEVENIDRSQYTTERGQGRADGILFALGMAMGIISRVCNIRPDTEGKSNA